MAEKRVALQDEACASLPTIVGRGVASRVLAPDAVADVIEYNEVDGRRRRRRDDTGLLIWWAIVKELHGQISLSSEAGQAPTHPVELSRGQAEG